MNQPKPKLCAYCGVNELPPCIHSDLCQPCDDEIKFRVEIETVREKIDRRMGNG